VRCSVKRLIQSVPEVLAFINKTKTRGVPIYDLVLMPSFLSSIFKLVDPEVIWAEAKKFQFDIFRYEGHNSWNTR
jgi:hypothetical protein